MRLKPSVDGPLSVYNSNDPNILNSPKRLNTLQNSNITANLTSNLTTSNINSNDIVTVTTQTADIGTLNNANAEDTVVQWCNSAHVQERELTNNAKNRAGFNINNNSTLAASLRGPRYATASSICSESSPDDSLLDYEEAHQSCSSIDVSPQDEDRGFDISDSESLSEKGNLNTRKTLQRRGIVNPNYPGFQHLAHTLDYGIKASSDTDFTDDDFEYESSTAKLNAAHANNINNNNNNNEEDVEYKIDSVNRLDSVENIQKVFYDKPVFNIPLQCEAVKRNNCDTEIASGCNSNSNQGSDDDFESVAAKNIHFNIHPDEDRLELITGPSQDGNNTDFKRVPIERAIEEELKEAIEKLSTSNDLEPSAAKCNIEPNTEQPFNKLPVDELELREATSVGQEAPANMAAISLMHISSTLEESLLKKQMADNYNIKISDAFLSIVRDDMPQLPKHLSPDPNANRSKEEMEVDVFDERGLMDSNREAEEREGATKVGRSRRVQESESDEIEKFCKEDKTKKGEEEEKDDDTVVPRKKEKMETNYVKKRRDYGQQYGSLITVPRREFGGRARDNLNRRSVAAMRDKKKLSPETLGSFDVYNIETAMPKIDLDAIETHLRAAREEERRRRTDREEIRRRLAMGSEDDYYSDRPGRKPSLQARLQSGMNLQICFMNETASDTDSPSSDSECPMTNPKDQRMSPKIKRSSSGQQCTVETAPAVRPATLSIGQPLLQPVTEPMPETDFFTRQARLQTEARMALAQAKEMARMQMEIERQRQVKSPITEMVRYSLEKVGIPFPEERRRLSRQILTEMNVAQLQVIVNDLHTQIETLNEVLVKFLMERDDLHMEQDSMLVDIEDLTRYLGAKEQMIAQNNNPPLTTTTTISTTITTTTSSPPRSPLAALNSSVKPHLHRIASLVKK